MRSPPENSHNHAQNDSDLAKSEDGGGGGDVFRNVSPFNCHYCDSKFGSVNLTILI